ncbi:MAG: hypothetical protein OQL19_06970 [Gammaproteobacteria bacterium]|nr:hypothetical protein [Gammaproteobacteria bacterium]
MNEIAAKISVIFNDLSNNLSKYVKAPKYLIAGLIVLFVTLLLFPLLKFLAFTLAAILIFIGFNPKHDLSQQVMDFFNKLK